MRDTVQHGGGHFFIAEDLRPFPEGQVGGDDHRGLFVELGDQMEEQLAGVFRKRQIPQFIEHHQIKARQTGGEPATATGEILLFQVVGQIYQVVNRARELWDAPRFHGFNNNQEIRGASRNSLQEISTELNWDDLVLSDDVLAQIDDIKGWIEYNAALLNDLGMAKKIKPGYRVLFHGSPGTGKTLTATLLGKYTGRKVFRIDLSTVVSKYIGDTEKNLAALFDRAKSRDWILFFDEADALFGKRTSVKDSHDRYANQEVSYLLQRVEEFDGLIILASNFKANLDEAFLRRFNAIIRFPFLKESERVMIWRKSFPENVQFENSLDLPEMLGKFELAGGSIINVFHHACLKMLARGPERIILLEDVLQGIRREVEKEGKVFKNLLSDTVNA